MPHKHESKPATYMPQMPKKVAPKQSAEESWGENDATGDSPYKNADDVCELYPESENVIVFLNNASARQGKFGKSSTRCLCTVPMTGNSCGEPTDYTKYFLNFKTFAELENEAVIKVIIQVAQMSTIMKGKKILYHPTQVCRVSEGEFKHFGLEKFLAIAKSLEPNFDKFIM